MLLNCGVGEDFWESLELQGDQTNQSSRKSVLNIHWKDGCWSWNSNTLATWCEELTHLKSPWCWERLKAGKEGDDKGWDGWMASPTRWAWIWISSWSWWWTGKSGVLQCMGSQSWTRLSGWTELRGSGFMKYWNPDKLCPCLSLIVCLPRDDLGCAKIVLSSHLARGLVYIWQEDVWFSRTFLLHLAVLATGEHYVFASNTAPTGAKFWVSANNWNSFEP